MIGQSRKHSFIECTANLTIGYIIAVAAQRFIFPMFGIEVPVGDNMIIAALFTGISLIRNYVLRRAFNWWHLHHYEQRLNVLSARLQKKRVGYFDDYGCNYD